MSGNSINELSFFYFEVRGSMLIKSSSRSIRSPSSLFSDSNSSSRSTYTTLSSISIKLGARGYINFAGLADHTIKLPLEEASMTLRCTLTFGS
jgi:hypothetical protein